MPMTSDAKQALKETVRGLRTRLLTDLHDAAESAWQMGVRAQNADLDEATRATRATFEAWAAECERRLKSGSSAESVGKNGAGMSLDPVSASIGQACRVSQRVGYEMA